MSLLLPEKLVNDAAGALQVALGVGEYARNRQGRFIVRPKGNKKLNDITTDLIPIYDTFALNVDLTTTAILRPGGKFILFDGNQQLTWQDTGIQQTIQKNDNWNNMSGTNGNVVGNNDAYAAIGIYFEFHPFISMQFENWFLKLLNPILSIEVGARKVKRFTTKMIHYLNYNALKGHDSLAAGTSSRGLSTRDTLPTQMWNVPLVLMPQDTIKIDIDFTNVAANYTGNYVPTATEAFAWQGAAAPTVTQWNRICFVSVGFFGLRGAKVA